MRAIRKEYPGVLALDGVDFEVHAGEVHCLLGENGAGKSTLMKILAGALRADAGRILIDGAETAIDTPIAAQALGIGMIYQDFKLVPELPAAANIMLGHEPRTASGLMLDRAALRRRATEVLSDLGGAVPMDLPVRLLSPAQRQFVEIAKALSRDVRVLVLDEPSVALTSKELERLFDAVRRLKAAGVGVVYISHRLGEIFEIGDRISILRDGRNAGTMSVNAATEPELIRVMVGRELSGEYPRTRHTRGPEAAAGVAAASTSDSTVDSGGGSTSGASPSPQSPARSLAEPLLRLRGVTGGIVRNVDLDLRAGEVLGLGGLAGAGRTELARILFGADPLESGSILLDGREIRPGSPRAAIDAGIGYLSEDRNGEGLVLQMSVRENMTLPTLAAMTKGPLVDRGAEHEACERFLRRLSIRTPGMERSVEELSGGNRQKVVLARWLLTRSRVLIFDEPTAGIDIGVRFEIYALIDQLAAGGIGVIVISSDLPELLGVSDRIAVMSAGRLAGVLAREEATQERVMELAMSAHGSAAA